MMQEKLVIYLRGPHPSWAVVNADGVVIQYAYQDETIGFSQLTENRQVIVIVPAEEVLLTRAHLPSLSRAKLLQAIPFALEEELVDEVDTLHFAVGGTQSDGSLAVGVVAKEKMQQWLAMLEAWQIQADQLIPASLALPYQENEWRGMVEDVAIVRTDLFQGFGCDKNNFADILNLTLTATEKLPHVIHIDNYTSTEISSELNATISINETMKEANEAFRDLAVHAGQAASINLLQGDYAVKKASFPQLNKLWKWTACAAGIWIALLFLYPTVSYFMLKAQDHVIELQIAQIYKRHFPQASSIIEPRLRMQEKLQKQNDGGDRCLLLISQVGQGLSLAKNVRLKRLDFQNDQLTLELTADTSEDFSAFTDYLSQQGLTIKQQSANLAGSHINATVEVE